MPEARSQTPTEYIYYYHNDHLGTPRVLTDDQGAVVWDVDYAPFGEISSYVTDSVTQPFRFPGQYEDLYTGLYYNWNRYYMPEVGRYNRFDSDITERKSISLNLQYLDKLSCVNNLNDGFKFSLPYNYTLNNPINYFDEEGMPISTTSPTLIGRCTFRTGWMENSPCCNCGTQVCRYFVWWSCLCLNPNTKKQVMLFGIGCQKAHYFVGCGKYVTI